jgi:predicted DNA binding protein
MISLTMDMVQYDCPYIAVTDEIDVSFYTMHWEFDAAEESLVTRLLVDAADPGALTQGLDALAEREGMEGFEIISRRAESAVVKSTIHETSAMRGVRAHDGYITGPFRISDGSELWNVGFDTSGAADEALADLERENDFTVEKRDATTHEDYLDVVRNVEAATELLEGCRELSAVERRTLRRAVEGGYFETPRDATLSTLASEFDVSKTAVSKNLRRGEGKVLERIVDAVSAVDGTTDPATDDHRG